MPLRERGELVVVLALFLATAEGALLLATAEGQGAHVLHAPSYCGRSARAHRDLRSLKRIVHVAKEERDYNPADEFLVDKL